MAVHSGSWFGLPDFGVTEAIGGLLKKPTTAQGGSNLIGSTAPRAQTPPQVLGTQAGPGGAYPIAGGYQAPLSGGNTGGVAAPTGGGAQPPLQEAPSAPAIDFDALIAPALQALDSSIAPLQQATDSTIQGINSNRQNQIASTNQSIGAQTNTINRAKVDQQGYERSAADEARRQYSEVQQGLQSRYGGTTGTGAFATELAGGQTIRSIAGIHEAASKALAGLDDKLVQVQEIGRIAIQNIENDANDQIAKAKSNLELALADIRNQKGQLMARKAEMAANAMQHYQDTVNQVNANNTAFKQQLFLQQQAAEQQLAAAKQRAQGIAGSANAIALKDKVGALALPGGSTTNPNQKVGGGTINYSQNSDPWDNLIEQQLNQQGLSG